MSRSVAWRRTVSDAASWHQDEASSATIYILREVGPTGFLLKEEGEQKYFKVFLGDPHTCTCSVFKKEKDLCKHICWVMMKKFRVSRQNPISWQLGLIEREIGDLVKGIVASQPVKPSATARQMAAALDRDAPGGGEGGNSQANAVSQREIGSDDVCPICQDELLSKHQPVTFCKFSCGNNVHIKCMKVWAEHQKSTGKSFIECPFCREDFGPISVLQTEYQNAAGADIRAERLHEHPGVVCFECHAMPITGKCYKCTTCLNFNLCQTCFNNDVHKEHGFKYRLKMSHKWRPAPTRDSGVLPAAVISNLLGREISDEDYDLLLMLDNPSAQMPSALSEAAIKSFPLERVRQSSILLAPGQQCCVCLRGYAEGQQVRRLPCRHRFHRDCIDDWLLNHHPTCPVDGAVYTNEYVRQLKDVERSRKQKLLNNNNTKDDHSKNGANRQQRISDTISLEIPGVGLAHRRVEIRAGDDGGGGHGGGLSPNDCLYVQDRSAVREMEMLNSNDKDPHRNSQSGSRRRHLRPLKNEPPADVAAITALPSGGRIAELGHGRGRQNLQPLNGLRLLDDSSSGNGEQDIDIPTMLLRRLKCLEDSSEARRCSAVLRHHRLLQNTPVSEIPASEFQREERTPASSNGLCTTSAIVNVLSSAKPTGRTSQTPTSVRFPLPPSIPLPHQLTDANFEISGDIRSAQMHKTDSIRAGRRGRLRLQPLYGDSGSKRNERHNAVVGSSEPEMASVNSRDLFVGNEPLGPSDLSGEAFRQHHSSSQLVVSQPPRKALYLRRHPEVLKCKDDAMEITGNALQGTVASDNNNNDSSADLTD